jgi:hypothetical protein
MSVSLLTLASAIGLALAGQAWQSIQGRRSSSFQPGRAWLWVPAYVLALLAGQAVLSWDLVPPLLFPPLHIVAASLPPLIILAVVGRSLGGAANWREMVLAVGSGAILSTFLSLALESAIIVFLLIALLIPIAVQPGGLDLIQTLTNRLQDPSMLQDPALLVPIVKSPLILVAIVFVVAGIIPVIEEAAKSVGVVLLAYRRPGPAQAMLWGLASGAGFALVESLFNSVSGLEAWSVVSVMRVGATLLHCFTGALMGLAWHSLLIHRSWWRGIVLYAVSAGAHGLWNALSVGMAITSLAIAEGNASDPTKMLVGLGISGSLALLVILALGVGLGLVGLVLYLRRARPTSGIPEGPARSAPPETAASRDAAGQQL